MIIDLTNVTEAEGLEETFFAGIMVVDGEATCVDGWSDLSADPRLVSLTTFCERMNVDEDEMMDDWIENIEVGSKYDVYNDNGILVVDELD